MSRALCRHRRVVGVAILLFAYFTVPAASAKPLPFGTAYQLELPDGWTVEEAAPKLKASSAGGINLRASGHARKTSAEAFADEYISRMDKNAGYKMAERGTVKHVSGTKAHFVRYEVDHADGAMTMATYFAPITTEELAALIFVVPTAKATTARSEVERIFNSVTVADKATGNDSWLAPGTDSETAAGASSTSATPRALAGVSPGLPSVGQPTPTQAATSGSVVKFGSCSLELPAGWTAEFKDDILDGSGPDGAGMLAASYKSAETLGEVIQTRLASFKDIGYELLDTDEVKTKAGAKGRLIYFKHKWGGIPKAEVTVAISAGTGQVALVSIYAPVKDDGEPDRGFMKATGKIFESVKLVE